jgi:putative CocE/NonD family hydrolase
MPRARRSPAVLAAAVLLTGGLAAVPFAGGAGAVTDPFQAAVAASAAPGHTWRPPAATYKDRVTSGVPVQMRDGVVLRADIDLPIDPATGAPATGPFPVLLTQTPYGKELAAPAGLGTDPYLTQHGYITVSVDVRGTGASGGTFTLFDPQQTADGVQLVHWAARLPHSTGEVGLYGPSYLGIDQLFTAGAVGPHSPVKAIFPVVSGNDIYRDTAFMGGIPDGSFDSVYLGGLLPVTNLLSPVASSFADPAHLTTYLQNVPAHLADTLTYNAAFIAQTYLGGADSYDSAFWQARRPADALANIVHNGIPAYLVGGEFDLFQRGEPLNFAALQNVWSGRSADAPMVAGQRVTGRYQLLVGPYTHLAGGGLGGTAFENLELEWFDTWLKGADTGMADTPTPLHYYDLGTKTYANTTTYPLLGATPTTFYFGPGRSGSAPSQNDGTLATAAPGAASGADSVLWAPVGSSICARSQDQWTMGAVSLLPHMGGVPVPCIDDDRLGQVGPTALTYSTAPMSAARTIAGPIAARIYAAANTTNTEWVVNVEDVAPDGTSYPLTQGALLGSFRAVNAAKSWTVNGKLLIPYHDYSPASATPVQRGAVTPYDIEVFPTYATIARGHRIRVTVTTTDFPHLTPTPPQLAQLFGGVYSVQRSASAPSSVTIPLI